MGEVLRVGHTGDWHLTEGPRFEATLRCLNFMVDDGRELGVNLWLVGGDLTGTQVPHKATILERLAIADVFIRMAKYAPVILCYGNHDYPNDLDIYGRLKSTFAISVFDQPHLCAVVTSQFASSEGAMTRDGRGGALLAVLPYPQKAHFVDQVADIPIADQDAAYADGLRGILDGWRARFTEPEQADKPKLLLAHINIGGSTVAGGEVMIGREIELAPRDLDELGVNYAALSHIHLYQAPSRVGQYAGSPDRSNFGETDEKGYVIVDIDPGVKVTVTRRLTPAQRLVTVETKWTEGRWDAPVVDVEANTEVRFVAKVDEQDRIAADYDALRSLAPGAADVKIDRRVQPAVVVRSTAIVEAKTTHAKLDAWLDTVQPPVTDEQRARLHGKLYLLETPAAAIPTPQLNLVQESA